MCLRRVEWAAQRQSDVTVDEEVGYKVFRVDGKSDDGEVELVSPVMGMIIETGEWLKAHCGWSDVLEQPRRATVRTAVLADDWKRYPCGFHVFTTKRGAMRFMEGAPDEVIRKVVVRKVVARGWQDVYERDYCCIVAQEMKVL
jgi:hypothetical protein